MSFASADINQGYSSLPRDKIAGDKNVLDIPAVGELREPGAPRALAPTALTPLWKAISSLQPLIEKTKVRLSIPREKKEYNPVKMRCIM